MDIKNPAAPCIDRIMVMSLWPTLYIPVTLLPIFYFHNNSQLLFSGPSPPRRIFLFKLKFMCQIMLMCGMPTSSIKK